MQLLIDLADHDSSSRRVALEERLGRTISTDVAAALEKVNLPAHDSASATVDGWLTPDEFYSFKDSCPPSLIRTVKFILPVKRSFISDIGAGIRYRDNRLIADLVDLQQAGVSVRMLIVGDAFADDVLRAIEAQHDTYLKVGLSDKAGELPDVAAIAAGMASCLPILESHHSINELSYLDKFVDGRMFASVACEAGFRSHLWGDSRERGDRVRSGRGVVLVSFGASYFPMTEFAAASIKRHNPDLKVAVVTDVETSSPYVDFFINPGNHVFLDKYFKRTKRMESLKFLSFTLSPFHETLFVDSDTYTIGDIGGIFDNFPNRDVILTNESVSVFTTDPSGERPLFLRTDALTDERSYNAGVFAFRSTRKAELFLTAWWSWFLYDQAGWRRSTGNWGDEGVSDQSVLHQLVWSNLHEDLGVNLDFAPNTVFNANDRMWELLNQSGLWSSARILHSKLPFVNKDRLSDVDLWQLKW